jgi:hypothetical protein
MAEETTFSILRKEEYLANPIEIGLDKDWVNKSKNFDKRMKMQGIYVFHISAPQRIIYVGKTRGPTMDFHTRLYRHATESASQSNPKVYRTLKKIKEEIKCPILVSLLTTEQIRNLFQGKQWEEPAMIDIYEQVLIHLLKPEVQEK